MYPTRAEAERQGRAAYASGYTKKDANMDKMTYEVVVHKAGLPLAKGESLAMFSMRLNKAAREHLARKQNLDPKVSSVFMCEVFDGAAVFDVYKRGPQEGPGEYKYFAVKYARKATGEFEFSDTTEVERVTSYVPKGPLEVAKAKKADEEKKAPGKQAKCGCSKEIAPGWQETAKAGNLWSGVI